MNHFYAMPGDSRRSELDAIQDRIHALIGERATVEESPRPLDEFRTLLDRAMPSYSGLRIAARQLLHDRAPGSHPDLSQPLSAADLQWLLGRDEFLDQVVARASPDLDSEKQPIAQADYTARLQSLDRDLRELQRNEEREVLRLYDQGIKAARRENADAAVIYEVWNAKEPNHGQD